MVAKAKLKKTPDITKTKTLLTESGTKCQALVQAAKSRVKKIISYFPTL